MKLIKAWGQKNWYNYIFFGREGGREDICFLNYAVDLVLLKNVITWALVNVLTVLLFVELMM